MARRRFARYLGEFALIVAGVVTALAAEEWVSGLRERSQAGDVKARLIEDLNEDAYQAGRRVVFYRRVADRAASVLQDLGSDTSVDDPTAVLMRAFDASRVYPLPQSRPTWDDLSSTGRLHLLQPEIRRAVSQHYRSRGDVTGLVNNLSIDYRRALRSILPVPLQDFGNRECEWFSGLDTDVDPPCDYAMPQGEAAAMLDLLRADRQLREDLNWYLSQVTTAVQIFEGAAEESRELIALLESR